MEINKLPKSLTSAACVLAVGSPSDQAGFLSSLAQSLIFTLNLTFPTSLAIMTPYQLENRVQMPGLLTIFYVLLKLLIIFSIHFYFPRQADGMSFSTEGVLTV